MRTLVTGGAGFIGHHLVNTLKKIPGVSVTVLDNLQRQRAEKLRPTPGNVTFHPLDIRDRSAVARAIHGTDVVFHLAAQSTVIGSAEDVEYSFSSNVQGTFNVLHAAAMAGTKRVVFTSSREVYGEPETIPVPETAQLKPKSHYGASKAAAEMYCRAFRQNGLQVVILRLANVYGPGDTGRVIPLFVEQALRGIPLVLYDGTQVLDFVWIGTVVSVLMDAGFREFLPGPINIGSGIGVTVRELAIRILELTNSRSTIHTEPRRDAEVSHFVADTAEGQKRLRLPVVDDPLFGLQHVIESVRNAIMADTQNRHSAGKAC